MPQWVKVYFTKDQHDEWKSGNGRAIGYLEDEVIEMRKLELEGIDCGLEYDPLDHMTKIDPSRLERIGWSGRAVYVR